MAMAPVICAGCGAAYDLHDYPAGYRFRCGCGQPVVRPETGDDAGAGDAGAGDAGAGDAGGAGAGAGDAGTGGDDRPRPVALPPHLRPKGAGAAATATGEGPGGCADPGPSPASVRALILACLFFVPGLPLVAAVLGWRAARAARTRDDEVDRRVAVVATAVGLSVTACVAAAGALLVTSAAG